MVLIVTGKRGVACGLVEVAKQGSQTLVRACNNHDGLKCPDAQWANITSGKLVGDRVARLQLKGYVDGGAQGAQGKVAAKLVSEKQFAAMAKPAIIRWTADSKPVAGLAIGDTSIKGIVAVRATYPNGMFYWAVEQDSNPKNKHERGSVTYNKGVKA